MQAQVLQSLCGSLLAGGAPDIAIGHHQAAMCLL